MRQHFFLFKIPNKHDGLCAVIMISFFFSFCRCFCCCQSFQMNYYKIICSVKVVFRIFSWFVHFTILLWMLIAVYVFFFFCSPLKSCVKFHHVWRKKPQQLKQKKKNQTKQPNISNRHPMIFSFETIFECIAKKKCAKTLQPSLLDFKRNKNAYEKSDWYFGAGGHTQNLLFLPFYFDSFRFYVFFSVANFVFEVYMHMYDWFLR